MKRQVNLATKEARAKLAAQHKPHWREIARGKAIGYAKGERGTTWRLREYTEGRYKERTLGKPDDGNEKADGKRVLTWEQVQRKALDNGINELPSVRSGYTVAEAIDDYFKSREAKSRSEQSLDTDKTKIKGTQEHQRKRTPKERLTFLAKFGARQVVHLRTDELQKWLDQQVADAMQKHKELEAIDRQERQRRAQATANRTWSIARAILNFAKQQKRLPMDTWSAVKVFQKVDAPRTRFLSVDECRRLLNACEPDFRSIARGALLTGMRYGELCKLKVADVLGSSVLVQASGSKNGRARTIPLTEEGEQFFADACAGKLGNDYVFTRADGAPWTNQHQKRRMHDACENGKVEPRATFHDLRRSYGSLLINSGMPLHMISRLLGHQSIEITRRVYALLEEKTLRDALQKHATTLEAATPSKVHSLASAKRTAKKKSP